MGKKKSFWISLAVQLVIALVIAALMYANTVDDLNPVIYEHKRYAAVPEAWPMYCASNALFVPGVMWLGVGGLMWIATTGFFDIFGYAFKSLLVLFSPLKKPSDMEHFADYKLAKEEKRAGGSIPFATLIVGGLLILGAAVFSFTSSGMLEEYLNSDAHRQSRQELLQSMEEDVSDNEAVQQDEFSDDDTQDPDVSGENTSQEPENTNETTGGENNE